MFNGKLSKKSPRSIFVSQVRYRVTFKRHAEKCCLTDTDADTIQHSILPICKVIIIPLYYTKHTFTHTHMQCVHTHCTINRITRSTTHTRESMVRGWRLDDRRPIGSDHYHHHHHCQQLELRRLAYELHQCICTLYSPTHTRILVRSCSAYRSTTLVEKKRHDIYVEMSS